MEIITDPTKKASIEDRRRRLSFAGTRIFNTSWATDKYGRRDTTNLAMFIALETTNGSEYYWLISESELANLNKSFNEVKEYNMTHDHQAREYERKTQQPELPHWF